MSNRPSIAVDEDRVRERFDGETESDDDVSLAEAVGDEPLLPGSLEDLDDGRIDDAVDPTIGRMPATSSDRRRT